jgi:hypothetical protein
MSHYNNFVIGSDSCVFFNGVQFSKCLELRKPQGEGLNFFYAWYMVSNETVPLIPLKGDSPLFEGFYDVLANNKLRSQLVSRLRRSLMRLSLDGWHLSSVNRFSRMSGVSTQVINTFVDSGEICDNNLEMVVKGIRVLQQHLDTAVNTEFAL